MIGLVTIQVLPALSVAVRDALIFAVEGNRAIGFRLFEVEGLI